MFEDGWAFDVLRGFGDYAYAEDRRKRPRRTETAQVEYDYEEEDLDDLLEDICAEQEEEE